MSKRASGIIVEIGGDTSKLSKALEDVNRSSKDLQRELRGVNTMLKFDPKNTTLLQQRQDILNQSIANTKDKLEKLKEAQKQVQEQFDKGEITVEQYRDFQREIIHTEQQLQKLEAELKNINAEKKTAAERAEDVAASLESVSGKAMDAGKSMTKKFTVPLMAVGTAASKLGVDFEKAMSEVAAVSGASADELKALEQSARDAGATTDKSAREAADALKYMALAGWDVETSQQALLPVLKLSSAAGMDLGRTSDLVTDSMSSMSMSVDELDRYLDVVSHTQSKANTSAEGMMEAYVKAGGTFKNMNVPLEESAAWIGVLANRGMKGAEAGNSLNSVMVNLSGSTDKTRGIFEELGIEIYDSQGNYIGLEATLEKLNGKFENMTEAEKNYYMAQLVGKSQIDTMTKLLDGLGDEYHDLKGSINVADGALEDMYDTATNNTMGAINNLKSALEELALKIFENLKPAIDSIVEVVQKVTDKFNSLSPEMQETIVKVGVMVAAIGPLLMIGAKLLAGMAGVIKTVLKIIKGGKLLVGVISAVSVPIGPLILIIGGLVAAVTAAITVFKNWGDISEWIKGKYDQLKNWFSNTFGPFIERSKEVVTNFTETVQLKLSELKEKVQFIFDTIREVVGHIVVNLVEQVVNLFDGLSMQVVTIVDGLATILEGIFEIIYTVVTTPIKLLKQLVTGDFEGMRETVSQSMEQLSEGLGLIFTGIKDMITGTVENIKDTAINAFNILRERVTGIFTSLQDSMNTIANGIKTGVTNAFTTLRDGVVNTVNNMRTRVTNVFQGLRSGITNIANGLRNGVVNIFKGMVNGAVSVFNGFRNRVTSIFSGIANTIKRLMRIDLRGIGRDMIRGLADGIRGAVSYVNDAVSNIGRSITNGFKSFFGIRSPSRLMRDVVGKMIPQGIAVGVEADTDEALDAVDDMNKEIMDASKPDFVGLMNGGSDLTTSSRWEDISMNTGENGTVARKLDSLVEVFDTYLAKISDPNYQVVLDNGTLVGELKNDFDRALGREQDLKDRGR